ncbi:MAG: transporter ATP-binding protein [Herminiimonas sp.]|nr:transporter ATP-binding protein [Herminiimonas sp.]MDB5853930.1 transporter ATP-binding protein [Herminiimonas sp.]
MPQLTLNQLCKTYGKTRVVDKLDLSLAQGELVSLLGPSGCGKTTTLRMIAGFIDPTGGTVEVDGKVLSSPQGSVPPERRGMSMIFQSYAIWPNMTVAENVGFGLTVRKVPAAELKRRVTEILDVVRLGALRDRYPAELSGGQQQRVALARSIVVRPDVLLLDEPLSNLDANLREEMRGEIRRLHDEFKITTVYVTHDQSEAMAISDRIAVMNSGRIEQVDSPWALYNQPRTPFVAQFIGRTNLLSGTRAHNGLMFDGFQLPASLLDDSDDATYSNDHNITVSVRPQDMQLCGQPPTNEDTGIEVSVTGRTYLGDCWDYTVMPAGGSGQAIKVNSNPAVVLEVGHRVWLVFNSRKLVAL